LGFRSGVCSLITFLNNSTLVASDVSLLRIISCICVVVFGNCVMLYSANNVDIDVAPLLFVLLMFVLPVCGVPITPPIPAIPLCDGAEETVGYGTGF